MAVSVPGIISGINTTKLISELMQAYQAPIQQLQSQVAQENSDLTAWGNLKGGLSQLQSALSGLSDLNSVTNRSVTSSNPSAATASVTNSANPGSFSVTTSGLAQAESLYSQGFSSASQVQIGTGTLEIKVGNGAVANIDINNTNDTLNGIASAINNANAGVQAGVVYDGTGYRLTLTGKQTGQANSFTVTASGATGNLADLNYNSSTKNMTESTSAQNASATINGIPVTSASNTISGAIPGVTLNLQQAGQSTTVTVSQDSSGLVKAVQSFVKGFNGAMKTINSLTSYNQSTGQAGPLLGNAEVQSLRTQLLNTVSGFGQGLQPGSQYNGLGSVGISINKDGTLSLDTSKLTSALKSNYQQVAGLLGQIGSSTNSNVQYVGASSQTQPGTYAVNVASPATQAVVQGSTAVPTSGIASSETLTITSGTASVNVSLASGSTISTIVSDINNALSQQGITGLTASDNNGYLKLGTSDYGSGQSFAVVSNKSASGQSGIGTSTLTGTGTDVAATVNGESVSANGQNVTVNGEGPAYGLKLKLVGAATGNIGSVTVSGGLYQQMNPLLSNLLNSQNGVIAAATNSINSTITSLNKQITNLQNSANQQKQLLQAQFNQMEQTLGQLKQTQQYISSYFGTSSGGGGGGSGGTSSSSSGSGG